ncbi:ribbon-helix-helix domain-containing protein [Athalassotoga sp.]|uniref:ribbon-helix-helix domain-containing protein n=1 Tax=Athalassotoga sp. TaxID=2022597 RepID=UPI003D04E378
MGSLSVRISEDLERKLKKYSKDFEIPKSYIVRKAIEKYIDNLASNKDIIKVVNSIEEDEPLEDEVKAIKNFKKRKERNSAKFLSQERVKKILND